MNVQTHNTLCPLSGGNFLSGGRDGGFPRCLIASSPIGPILAGVGPAGKEIRKVVK